jgi:hypothetical protein
LPPRWDEHCRVLYRRSRLRPIQTAVERPAPTSRRATWRSRQPRR